MSVYAIKEVNKDLKAVDESKIRYSVSFSGPFLLFSDVHSNYTLVEQLRLKHPRLPAVCLGDLVNMAEKQVHTDASLDYFRSQSDIYCIKGNHDRVVRHRCAASPENREFLRRLSPMLNITANNQRLLAYHSLPKDEDTFVQSTITEEQFIKAYPLHLNPVCIFIGHNHKLWQKTFTSVATKLISVGALCEKPHPYLLVDTSLPAEKWRHYL
jgi:predicted phosphodiesterase